MNVYSCSFSSIQKYLQFIIVNIYVCKFMYVNSCLKEYFCSLLPYSVGVSKRIAALAFTYLTDYWTTDTFLSRCRLPEVLTC